MKSSFARGCCSLLLFVASGLPLTASAAEESAERPTAEVAATQPDAPEPSFRQHELTLFPAVTQLNVADTLHVGGSLMYSLHLTDGFAVQLAPFFNYVNGTSPFKPEAPQVLTKEQRGPTNRERSLEYGGVASMEFAPWRGDLSLFDTFAASFSIVVNGGVGLASSRVQFRPDSTPCETGGPGCIRAAYGDAGLRFLTQVGAGVRVRLGERVALRLEVRDVLFSNRLRTVNGCTFRDIDNLDKGLAAESGACRPEQFRFDEDKPLARKLLEETSAALQHVASVYGGVSFLF